MSNLKYKWAALPNLPTELLELIGEELGLSFGALSALARVSKGFHAVFTRFLYDYDSPAKAHAPILIIGAARCGNLPALQLAHEKYGADLNRIRIYPMTVKERSKLGIKYNLSPAARWGTPLHFAVAAGQMKVVAWLMSKGVNLEAPGRPYCGCETVEENMPTYHRSFEYGPSDPYYFQPQDRKVMAWTPLHYAICQGHTGIAHRLLNAGASPECVIDRSGPGIPDLHEVEKIYNAASTVLQYDAHAEGSHLTWIKAYGRTYRALGDASSQSEPITALHTAALHGNKTISRRLVRKTGVDINSSSGSCGSRSGRFHGAKSPLSYVMLSADRSMTHLFLSMRADPVDYGMASIYSRAPAVAVAFDLRRPEAVMTLLRSGSPAWKNDCRSNAEGSSLLPYIIWNWRERCEPTSPEDVLPKRRAFLMLTRETVKSLPFMVSRESLQPVLMRTFFLMCTDKDFDLKSLMEYLKITGLTLETPVKYSMVIGLTLGWPVEEGPTLGTAALSTIVCALGGLPPLSPRNVTIINYLLENGASTTIAWGGCREPLDEFLRGIVGEASGKYRGEFAKKVAKNVTGIIDFVNLFASHVAFDRVEQKDRDGVLQAYGNLVGLGGEHALDLPTRRRLRVGTVASIPRRLLKTLRGFETGLY
ncbi:ankyrin-like protein [Colletotrichum sojae]|uniref:Ankyrin-like protein n=1 Tax=Colletotrichum sojae TaxID=2175907 RepID=A0A8H6MLE5_9PEZI|nr:ankyrin-like protein [Colletotrichum sojae]